MRTIGHNDTRERILKYIHDYYAQHDYAPTVRDILKGLTISSTAVVQHHLNILQRQGRIHRDPEVFRSIRLVDKKGGLVPVPVLGMIAAGKPIPVPSADTWATVADDILELPRELTGGKQVYALRVKGRSMIDALIDDGDIVIMEPTNTAENGQMVAAWLKNEHEVTLKRFYRDRTGVTLKPANQSMQPIHQPAENVEVQGRVVGVIRKL